MGAPPTQLGAEQIEELILEVQDLRHRVEALEKRSIDAPEVIAAPAVHHELPADLSTGLLAGLGRLLLGIAGAYLLRAITEAGILPQLAGTLLGLLYAAAWLAFTLQLRSRNRFIVALQVITASMIAAPLLWESTVRFHSLSNAAGAAGLAAFVILGQFISWRRNSAAIAAITAAAGVCTGIALIIATLDPVPFAVALVIAAAGAEFGAIRDRALNWRWIAAIGSDFCAGLLIYLATRPQGLPEGYAPLPHFAVVAIPCTIALVYLASTVARTLFRRLPMTWFELLQIAVAAALAVRVTHISICLIAGALAYAVAVAGIAKRRNFHIYAMLGLLLIAVGSFPLAHELQLALWISLALAGIWLGNTFRFHAAVYLAAASFLSAPLTALAAAIAYFAAFRHRKNDWQTRVAPAMFAALFCWNAASFASGFFAPAIANVGRTALISVVAIALAWCARRWKLIELTWVLFPWMTLGAIKLVAEDFEQGRSATLFLSLFLYGGTLIVLPRLARYTRSQDQS